MWELIRNCLITFCFVYGFMYWVKSFSTRFGTGTRLLKLYRPLLFTNKELKTFQNMQETGNDTDTLSHSLPTVKNCHFMYPNIPITDIVFTNPERSGTKEAGSLISANEGEAHEENDPV